MKLLIYLFCCQFVTGFLIYKTNGYRDIKNRVKRIVGGLSATGPNHFPWMAMVSIKGVYVCGGSIIEQKVILSAAHCFKNVKETDVKIFVGKYHKDTKDPSEKVYYVSKIIKPHCYSYTTPHIDDIALIILTEEISYNTNVKTINLPFGQPDPTPSSHCKIMGWGLTDTSETQPPKTLQYADVTILDDDKCQTFLDITCKSSTTQKTICTGSSVTTRNPCVSPSPCNGDSGGPLACMVNGIYMQFGIIVTALEQ